MFQTLISVLMTTLAPMTPYTIVEDTSQLPLLNPDLSQRRTLKLCLANGLEVLLISDPNADQSAASVCVGSGSWSDPKEYPGMAHFCEHMLFMGTKKYPNENGFFSAISDYAGMTNAYTAPNRTVYMFSAQTSGFLKLLDQFGNFFIEPLFNQANIARELHAVDQEFAKNLENDGWREYMVFKETGNPDHPNQMFSTGNSQTLGKIPQSELKKWNREYYGSDKMHLVLYSSLPLDTLKEATVQIFSEVPRSLKSPIDHSGSLGSNRQQGHITYVKPIQHRQSLSLSWELPLELAEDKAKSAEVLAYALRRGQKYSLQEALKKDQLIDSMSISVDDLGGPTHRFFQISLELTRLGIKKVEQVIFHCFEAVAGLKVTGVPAYLFQEKNTMARLSYQYQGRQDPFEYIMKLGDGVAEEDLSSFPRNSILAADYEPEKINEVAHLLTPRLCSISFMAPPELTHVEPDQKEKWFGTEYAIRPIPEKWLSFWESAQSSKEIRLADPNPFLPENLGLAPAANNTPLPIADDELGIAYYVRSSEFGTPDAVYQIHILSPELKPTARSSCLASLYIDHLTDLLHPTLAAASSAGLFCSFDMDRSALKLSLSGYSEKAPLLLQEITRQMPLDPPTPEQFAIYMDRHEKAYQNADKELAARQAKELIDSIINRDNSTRKEKLLELKTISYEEFLNFHENLFSKTYIQALFAGNLTLKEAESAWLDIIHALSHSPFPKEEQMKTKVLQLPDFGGPYQISQSISVQGNATLLLLDEGPFSYEKRASQEILSACIKEAFFNELRTKQKTGYIAQSDGTEVEERLFQFFLVQSNSHQPDDLLYRFEQFIEEFSDSLSQNVSPERFTTLKTSQISSLKNRFRNLRDKSALWDRLSFEKDGDFAFVEKRIEALSQLKYEEFLKDSAEFLSRVNRRRLAILMEGKLETPFAYQPIALRELPDVVIYAPRPEKALQEETLR